MRALVRVTNRDSVVESGVCLLQWWWWWCGPTWSRFVIRALVVAPLKSTQSIFVGTRRDFPVSAFPERRPPSVCQRTAGETHNFDLQSWKVTFKSRLNGCAHRKTASSVNISSLDHFNREIPRIHAATTIWEEWWGSHWSNGRPVVLICQYRVFF